MLLTIVQINCPGRDFPILRSLMGDFYKMLQLFQYFSIIQYGITSSREGFVPTVIVVITVSVEPSITDTLLLPLFATYILLLLGLTATPIGSVPTVIVVITVSVEPSITDTVPSVKLAT
ncbi:hypothetical protein ES705_51024 [subsurface metagenome]